MPPVRVLQVIDSLGMGGAETWLMELLRFWAGSDTVKMDFLLTGGERAIFDDEAQALGAALYYVPYKRRRLLEFALAFRRILHSGRYDAIHDHHAYPAGWHFLMASGLLPPVRIIHVHNPSFGIYDTYGVTPSRRVAAKIGKYLVGHYATYLTGTSRQILTEYGFDAPSFRDLPKAALYCGVDPRRFAGEVCGAKATLRSEFRWPDDAKVVLVAGRMDESPDVGHPRNHKNTGFAVDVLMAAMRRDARMRAIFAGKTSSALPTLEARIAKAGMTDRFAFAGVRSDIGCLMLGSDVLLFPSRGEGLGMVAVEAQASGLPVLASTAVPRECVVIPDLVTFLDITAGADRWADNIIGLALSPRDAASSNRRIAESAFSIKTSAHSLIRLYRTGSLPREDK